MHGVSKAHGFADGNKRTALLLTLLLFEQSGYEIELRDDERFDDLVVDVVQGSMDQNALVEWLRARTIGPAY